MLRSLITLTGAFLMLIVVRVCKLVKLFLYTTLTTFLLRLVKL